MKKDVFGSIVAGTVAGLFAGSIALAQAGHPAPTAPTTDKAEHCKNGCKGKSECKTATSDCHGHNACKGKGHMKAANAAECKKKGGEWK